jgi:hypothetical protein
MPKLLLDRQVSLIRFLTSRGAIFGDRDEVLPEELSGIDRQSLNLEARISYEKRMDKILAVFSKTLERLGSDRDSIGREFVEACPPSEVSRIENARQFYRFLSDRWQREPPSPPYLVDLAACEHAYAEVRADADNREGDDDGRHLPLRPGMRRRPGIALVHCAYDIQPIFVRDFEGSPTERDTYLVIAMPVGANQPRVFEVLPVVFELLTALEDWTDTAVFGVTAEADELINELREHGLLEVCR